MIPVKHIDPDDLPLFAMQMLPADETKELAQNLQHSSEARRVLSEIYGDLVIFAHTAEMHAPPSTARERLIRHVAREKKVVPMERATETDPTPAAPYLVDAYPARRSLASRVLPWVGWAVAAGIAVEAGFLFQQKERLVRTAAEQRAQLARSRTSAEFANLLMDTLKNPAAQNVVLTPEEGKLPPQGRAIYDPEKGSLIFVASNLEPVQPYKTYELWLLPADAGDPIPAGTFHPDGHGNAVVILPALPRGTVAKGFGITVEDGQGSPVPTSPIILKGTAA